MSRVRQRIGGGFRVGFIAALPLLLLTALASGCAVLEGREYDTRFANRVALDPEYYPDAERTRVGVDDRDHIVLGVNDRAQTNAEGALVLYYDRLVRTEELITTIPAYRGTPIEGLVWDYDSDGDLDVIVAGSTGLSAAHVIPDSQRNSELDFYKIENLGDDRFSTQAEYIASIPNFVGAKNLSAGDYNQDGIEDLLITAIGTDSPHEARSIVFGVRHGGGGRFNTCTDFIYTPSPDYFFPDQDYHQGDCYVAKYDKLRTTPPSSEEPEMIALPAEALEVDIRRADWMGDDVWIALDHVSLHAPGISSDADGLEECLAAAGAAGVPAGTRHMLVSVGIHYWNPEALEGMEFSAANVRIAAMDRNGALHEPDAHCGVAMPLTAGAHLRGHVYFALDDEADEAAELTQIVHDLGAGAERRHLAWAIPPTSTARVAPEPRGGCADEWADGFPSADEAGNCFRIRGSGYANVNGVLYLHDRITGVRNAALGLQGVYVDNAADGCLRGAGASAAEIEAGIVDIEAEYEHARAEFLLPAPGQVEAALERIEPVSFLGLRRYSHFLRFRCLRAHTERQPAGVFPELGETVRSKPSGLGITVHGIEFVRSYVENRFGEEQEVIAPQGLLYAIAELEISNAGDQPHNVGRDHFPQFGALARAPRSAFSEYAVGTPDGLERDRPLEPGESIRRRVLFAVREEEDTLAFRYDFPPLSWPESAVWVVDVPEIP